MTYCLVWARRLHSRGVAPLLSYGLQIEVCCAVSNIAGYLVVIPSRSPEC